MRPTGTIAPKGATARRWGELIAERRKAAGMSQTELAQRIGVTQGTVSQIERGRRSGALNLDLIAKIDEVLGLDLTRGGVA